MIKDQVWWPGNQCCGQTTNPKHRFKTTISNFVVISEELTKNSPEITRLPKMGPTQWYCVNYRTECNCKHHLWPLGTKLTYELVDTEILSRSSTCLNKKPPRTYRFELTIRILEDWSVPLNKLQAKLRLKKKCVLIHLFEVFQKQLLYLPMIQSIDDDHGSTLKRDVGAGTDQSWRTSSAKWLKLCPLSQKSPTRTVEDVQASPSYTHPFVELFLKSISRV